MRGRPFWAFKTASHRPIKVRREYFKLRNETIDCICILVFGKNTASDISKLSEWYLENFEILRAGHAIYLCRSCYYLSIIEAKKFSVTHKRPFFLRLKKNNKQACTIVTIFLRQWKK